MEEGYKDWVIVRKLLVDNRLEHAALLAHSLGVSPTTFAARARIAIGRVELKIVEAVNAANEARAEMAEQLARAAEDEEDKQTATPEQPSVEEPPKEG